MTPELGHAALIIAVWFAVAQAVVPMAGSFTGHRSWMRLGHSLAVGQLAFMALSFACLANAFLLDDFSVAYVANNSNTLLPDRFKFSAVWGAHEGSLLLWALILAGWSAAVALLSKQLPLQLSARVLSVLGAIAVGFGLFLLYTSNPFERILPVSPIEGGDLNPLLQDFGLIVHPPMLYMGYVGFSVPFAFAIAALIGGLGVFDRRHRLGKLVGLLRIGLGWLVVLGSSRECVLYALVGGHRAGTQYCRHRKTRGV